MLGAEGSDDRLTPILTAAAIAHPVQGDYDIFAHPGNGSVHLPRSTMMQAPATSGAPPKPFSLMKSVIVLSAACSSEIVVSSRVMNFKFVSLTLTHG